MHDCAPTMDCSTSHCNTSMHCYTAMDYCSPPDYSSYSSTPTYFYSSARSRPSTRPPLYRRARDQESHDSSRPAVAASTAKPEFDSKTLATAATASKPPGGSHDIHPSPTTSSAAAGPLSASIRLFRHTCGGLHGLNVQLELDRHKGQNLPLQMRVPIRHSHEPRLQRNKPTFDLQYPYATSINPQHILCEAGEREAASIT